MATAVQPQHFEVTSADLQLLETLTGSGDLSSVPRKGAFQRREAPLDPLLFAAATASGPHVTRHHYHHDFFPIDEESENPLVGSYQRCDGDKDDKPRYTSQQKPRRERLRELGVTEDGRAAVGPPRDEKLEASPVPLLAPELRSPTKSRRRRSSLLPSADPTPAIELLQLPNPPISAPQPLLAQSSPRDHVIVQCRARTRIPTPHGPAFLHIYHNNRDAKEHLAIVIDSAQLDQADQPTPLPPIRSVTLDAVWREGETETERIVRGAYVGRLSSSAATPSSPTNSHREYPVDAPAPLVRIHSECFTGETIGSMRCDCGEQLDEAMRLIAQPVRISSTGETVPGRGAIVYMRQEGRGIGLLEKIRAYNLQDLGHDTVTANLMLGHGADERGYEIAAAIMRDLGLETDGRGVRLLTNNPEKMEALERENIRIEQRVGMVPRSWKSCAGPSHGHGRGRARTVTKKHDDSGDSDDSYDEHLLRRGGATLIGGGAAHGVELERYLATKVQRMGHMLDLPSHSSSEGSGLGLVSQAVSDDEDGMSKSVGSLLDSPELEFDSASYKSRSISPVEIHKGLVKASSGYTTSSVTTIPNAKNQTIMATLSDLYPALSAVAEAIRLYPAQLKAAEAQLGVVLKVPGAYDALHEISAQKTIPEDVRQLAISRVKNMVVQSWRSKATFNDEHRERIKARVMLFLDEPNNAIAYHNETIVGKIARQDFPRSWPNIVANLLEVITVNAQKRLVNDTSDPNAALVTRRALQVLAAILEEYTTKVIMTTTVVMIELTETLLAPLSGLYGQFSGRYFSRLNPETVNDPDVATDVEIAQLLFRSITRLMVYVWHRVKQIDEAQEQTISEFFQSSVTQLEAVFNFRVQLVLALHSTRSFGSLNANGEYCLQLLKDHIQFVTDDYFRTMQKQAISRFMHMPKCVELVRYCWDQVVKAMNNPAEYRTNEAAAAYPSQFLCSAMLMFKESLAMWSPNKQTAEESDILPPTFVESAVNQLVQTFLPLSDTSLELWATDPEGFIEEEEKGGDSWEIDPRPCAERVLITLAAKYTDIVVPVLKSMYDVVIATPTTDLITAKQKEALYAAIGRCSHRLKDVINFDEWLAQVVVKEVSSQDPVNRVVKRRVAWVIARWYSDKEVPASGGTIWEVLRFLIQDQGEASDLVVRLTAAMALGECVDTLGFDADAFQPHLPFMVESMVQLMSECETFESRTRVIKSLSLLVDCVGPRIVPLIGPIQQVLASLWQAAGATDGGAHIGGDGAVWLFKANLLVLAKALVSASKEQSNGLVGIVIPLIRESLSEESRLHLDDDAYQLWLAALRNAATLPPPQPGVLGLSDLIADLVMCMDTGFDVLGTLLQILEAYILLNATLVVQFHGLPLFQVLKKVLSSATISLNVKDVLNASDLLFQLADVTSWPGPMHNSEYFWDMLKAVIEDKANASLLADHICVFSRMILQEPNVFVQLITAGASVHQAAESPLFEGLLDQWWNKFDVISEPRHRKLTGMAIAGLVSTGRHEVMDRLASEILNMWTDVHGELNESKVAMEEWVQNGSIPEEEPLYLHWAKDAHVPPDSFMRESEGTLEEERRKRVWENDPIRKIKFTAFVAEKMQQGTVACGGQEVLQTKYLKNAEPALLRQLEVALASGL